MYNSDETTSVAYSIILIIIIILQKDQCIGINISQKY